MRTGSVIVCASTRQNGVVRYYLWVSPELELTAALFSQGCSRRCKARASERKALAGAGDDGDQASVLWKQWGWRWWPDFKREFAGVCGGSGRIPSSLVAEGAG